MNKTDNGTDASPGVASSASLNRIAELESVARRLEPGAAERNDIVAQSVGYVDNFIESLPDSKAFVNGDCSSLRSLKIGDGGKSFEQLLEILQSEVNHVGINSASGANFGYIQSGGIWASAIADMLAAATNRYAGVYFSSPGAVIIENQMIRWLSSLVGYPTTSHGNLGSGGSIANLIAIQTARDSFGINSTNVKDAVVYFTEQVHHCIHKALHITGLDGAMHRIISMNSRYQMDTEALRDTMARDKRDGLRPFLVVATAGTTDTGAIDPLDQIADLCSEHEAWFHIDAAYGGFFVLLNQLKEKFKGIERSDSLVMDPHKSMFLPFGLGVVLVKNGAALLASNSHEAPYMQDAYGYDEISPADSGPELTKHFRGLRMWLPLHLYGLDVFRANLEEKILLSRYFNEEIKKMGFETGPDPGLSISLFRFPANDRNDFNRRLLDSIRDDGRCFFSSTMIDGEFWIRCAVLNFRTHLRETQLALQVIGEKLRELK
jgi:aromatic-L-amino-acid/L-tryptophan decarboxylase